ncbi:putative ribonuclease H-like domain-containing protein [Tanacetum coccineum]
MAPIDDTGIFGNAYDHEDVGTEADLNNLETTMNVSPIPTTRIDKDHPKDQIIGDLNSAIQTRRMAKISDEHAMFSLSKGTQESDSSSRRSKLYRSNARGASTISTLEEEGIDYDEVFAPVARIEAIRLFLAYASFMGFIVYQMDVKSAFLYGIIEEEVYVCQPSGFEDLQFPDKVYKVEKALYGLHQAPRAWYETLSTYLLENGFRRGTIDNTLFIQKDKDDILLVQVYVDDIIFKSTKKSLCDEFEGLMHKRFQMSSMGELTFFLGLQVQQKEDGIFISQDKYVADIMKKFDYVTVKTASTPMEPNKALVKDEEADNVDVHLYRSMIGSLMYLTASRPDITFAVCACVRDSPFDLEAFSGSNYAGASLDRKSTIGGEANYVNMQSRMDGRTCNIKRGRDTKIPQSGGPPVKMLKLGLRLYLKSPMIHLSQEFNTLGSGEDIMKLMELMEHCTKLSELIIDFLTASHIKYALTENPTIYVSLIEQFWQTATASTLEDGDMSITATIDGKVKVVFKASIRRHLKLKDYDGISTLSTAEIFEQLALMSSKKTAWEQFSSNIATAIICLATNRTFNFSKLIFEAMVKNLDSKTKFLMYPRFIQIFLNKHKRFLLPHKRIYIAPTLTQKLFSIMKRASKGYTGANTPLFQTMLVQGQTIQGEGSTIPVESHHTPTSVPSIS